MMMAAIMHTPADSTHKILLSNALIKYAGQAYRHGSYDA